MFAVAGASREHAGAAPAHDADDSRVRAGRGARARRLPRARGPHQPRHVPRVLHLHAAAHAADPAARGDPHRRPARTRGCRAHLRPARLDAARPGRARTRSRLEVPRGEVRFDARDVRLHVDRAGAPRLLPDRRGGRDGRARRHLGVGQVDRGSAAAALLRRPHGQRHDRRHRRARRHARSRSAGRIGVVFEDSFLFSDTISANIAFARPDATPARDRSRRARGGSARLHPATPIRLRHGRRRAGPHAVGWPTSAHRAGARAAVGSAASSCSTTRPRRSTRASRRRSTRRCAASLPTARRSSSRTAGRRCRSPIASSSSTQGASLDTGTHDELWARCSLYRLLLSGPGDDAEGIDARAPRSTTAPTTARSTASRPRRGVASTPTNCAANRSPAARRSATQMRMAGGGGGGGGNWSAAMGGALAPTPELLAQVDALPPADADPRSRRRRSRAGPRPTSGSSASSGATGAGCSLGLVLVAVDAVCTLAGPMLVRYGIDHGVVDQSTQALFGPRRSCSSASRSSTGG